MALGNRRRSAARRLLPILLLVLILILAFFPPPGDLGAPAYRALLIACAAVVLWIGELLPAAVTGILVVILLAVTGAAPSLRAALDGFSRPVCYFLGGVIAIAISVEKTGLAERLSRFMLRWAGGAYGRMFWELSLTSPLHTLILPSATARCALLAGIYDRALARSGVKKGSPLSRAVMMSLCSINRLASTTILTGGVAPMMGAALIGGIGWGRWFVLLGLPFFVMLSIGSGILYLWHMRGRPGRLVLPEEPEPPLRAEEWRAAAVLLGASALWLTDEFHGMHPVIPALGAWVLLLSPKVGVLSWREFEQRFQWSAVFVLASTFSLGTVLVDTGAARWLARGLLEAAPAMASHPYLLLGVLFLAAVPIRILVPNLPGFLAIMIPISLELGRATGLNPTVCALGMFVMGDTALFYPAQAPSALLIYDRGHLRAGEIFLFGLMMTAVAYVVTMTFTLFWWEAMGLPWRTG